MTRTPTFTIVRNKHEGEKQKLGRGSVGKTPVLGMRERGGRTKAMPIQNTSIGEAHRMTKLCDCGFPQSYPMPHAHSIPPILDRVTDKVLSYKPKPKTKAAKKRARRKKRKKKRD